MLHSRHAYDFSQGLEAHYKTGVVDSRLESGPGKISHRFDRFRCAPGWGRFRAQLFGLLFKSHEPLTVDDLTGQPPLSHVSRRH